MKVMMILKYVSPLMVTSLLQYLNLSASNSPRGHHSCNSVAANDDDDDDYDHDYDHDYDDDNKDGVIEKCFFALL